MHARLLELRFERDIFAHRRFAGHIRQHEYERMPQEQVDETVKSADLTISKVLPAYEAAQNKLALVYSAVLQWNLQAKFDNNLKFDESAFYELLYKLMTHAVRKWRVGDIPLCPSALWKEIDVELGRVFRGSDFNLEMRGLVRDKHVMGRWRPQRGKDHKPRQHEHRTPNFTTAVLQRSPALGRCLHPDERNGQAKWTSWPP